MIAQKLEVLKTPTGMKLIIDTNDRTSSDKLVMLSLGGKLLDVDIKRYREKRSRTANNYLWQLLDKMAIELKSTKVEIYHEAIRQVGLFKEYDVLDEAIKDIAKGWMNNGNGWLVEVAPSSREGCHKVRFYRGSSVYKSDEMARLIDYVVVEAKELGVETLPPHEIERLKGMVK